MALKDLISNKDDNGHNIALSTTRVIQLGGFVAMASILFYAIYVGRPYVPELFSSFALYCGGIMAVKGAVSSVKAVKKPQDFSTTKAHQSQREDGYE